jgi:hypothetical protein
MQCLCFFDQISHHGNKKENPMPIVQRTFVVVEKMQKVTIFWEKKIHMLPYWDNKVL